MRVFKNCFFVFVLALGLLFTPVVGRALTIDFGVAAPTPGTISYNGLGGPLVGTNIQVDNVVDNDVGAPVYTVINGLLNFTTGNLTGTSAGPPPVWNFGGGPLTTITIVGGVGLDLNSDGDFTDAGESIIIPAGTTLLSGNFGTAYVTVSGTFKIAGSAFFDIKDDDLVTLFGGDPSKIPSWNGNFNISFNAAGSPPAGFTSTSVLSGDVVNTPVPEPATMLLLGSGLLGIGIYARRRFKK
jgi:hypothetical protein